MIKVIISVKKCVKRFEPAGKQRSSQLRGNAGWQEHYDKMFALIHTPEIQEQIKKEEKKNRNTGEGSLIGTRKYYNQHSGNMKTA